MRPHVLWQLQFANLGHGPINATMRDSISLKSVMTAVSLAEAYNSQ